MKNYNTLISAITLIGIVLITSSCNYRKTDEQTKETADSTRDINTVVEIIADSSKETLTTSPYPVKNSAGVGVTKSEYSGYTQLTAYRKLLEKDEFDWDENGFLQKTENMQFALIGIDDNKENQYLLLKNDNSYAVAGTQHLLYFSNEEIKTLWGYGQNCIYIEGFLIDKNNALYLEVGGGRQDTGHGNIIKLDGDKINVIAETFSRILWNEETEDADVENQYYWNGNEVSEEEYQNNFSALFEKERVKISWLDNTEENRELVF